MRGEGLRNLRLERRVTTGPSGELVSELTPDSEARYASHLRDLRLGRMAAYKAMEEGNDNDKTEITDAQGTSS